MLNRLLLSPIIFSGYNFHVVLCVVNPIRCRCGDMRVLGHRYRVVCAGIQYTVYRSSGACCKLQLIVPAITEQQLLNVSAGPRRGRVVRVRVSVFSVQRRYV